MGGVGINSAHEQGELDMPESEFTVPDPVMVRLYEALDFYSDAGKVTEEEYREMRAALDALAQLGSE